MAPVMMGREDSDEDYLISMARNCQANDPYATKAWIITAKTLFPENFSIQYEAYCMARDTGNVPEAAAYLEEMFRKFSNEHHLWEEIFKIAKALQTDLSDKETLFLRGMFGHLPTKVQHEILLAVADHCMDTIDHCNLMLLLLQRFPEKINEHGMKLMDTLQVAEKHSHCQGPINQYRKLLVCDVAPLVLKSTIEIHPKYMHRLLYKCIEFYIVYIYTPNSSSKLKLNFGPEKGMPLGDSREQSETSELWAHLFSFVEAAGCKLNWELTDLMKDPVASCNSSDSQWQRVKNVLHMRPSVIDEASSSDPEAFLGQQKQVFYCTFVIFLHSLYNYGKYVNPSWFSGSAANPVTHGADIFNGTSEISGVLVEGIRWISAHEPDVPKHKKRKAEIETKESDPPVLTVSKCMPPDVGIVLAQSFLTAIKCLKILQYVEKEYSRFSQHLHMEEWPWFQSFFIDSLIYRDHHKDAITRLYKAAENLKDPTVKNKVNLQLASCFHAVGDYSTACAKLMDVVCSLAGIPSGITSSTVHQTDALYRKNERKLIFISYDRREILQYCVKTLLTCFKEKVLRSSMQNDMALGHLIVLTQFDWPEEEQLFLKLLDTIKKQGNFCYGLFFNYIINSDILEELMYITTSSGGGVTLDLLPTSTTQVGRQRAVTRGVNKGAKEDLKMAMERQMSRCDDDVEHLLVQFFKQERDLLQQHF